MLDGVTPRDNSPSETAVGDIERIYGIHKLIRSGRKPSMAALLKKFEVSPATLKRDIEYMRNRLGAPILYDSQANGYYYEARPGEPAYELPGLWLDSGEVHALLLMNDLLAQLQSGILRETLKPLEERLKKLMGSIPGPAKDLRKRVVLLPSRARRISDEHFQAVATATLQRRRLRLKYFARARAERRERDVSPQRLIHYGSNWYLHGWCHLRNDLRSFALDSIETARILDEPAHEPDPSLVQSHIGAGYGIFSGPTRGVAILDFNAESARWVRREIWHPDQQIDEIEGGGVRLKVPMTHPQELYMDILRHGANVEVVAPAQLRLSVGRAHRDAAILHETKRIGPVSATQAG